MSGHQDGTVPVLLSPRTGITVSDVAVHFLWTACKDSRGYQIHYDQDPAFSGGVCKMVISTEESNRYSYLPEQIPKEGKWFWRVRSLLFEGGKFGPWSETGSFNVVPVKPKQKPQMEISPDHPLFALLAGREVGAYWDSISPALRPYTALRVEERDGDDLIALCQEAQDKGVPIIAQLIGPHDVIGGTYGRIPLADVELLFQRFPVVKGVQIVEQSCQNGMANPVVPLYVKRLLPLAASYGRLFIWADGLWHGNNLWVDVLEDEDLFSTLVEYAPYFVPAWKMNCAWTPYLIQSCVLGIWLSGAAAQWGVEPESWYWHEAGFTKLNEQYGFKEGELADMPPAFYGVMTALGISAGASVYILEPPNDFWSKPGETTKTWNETVLPLFSKILEWKLIPRKHEVQDQAKVAYRVGREDSLWLPENGGWLPAYDDTYGRNHPFQMIPSTGRYYWIPAVSRHSASGQLVGFKQVVTRHAPAIPAETADLFNRHYPEVGSGSAWRVKVGDLFVIMYSRENRDGVEDFSVDLEGGFARMEGTLPINSFLLVKQPDPETLLVHTHGRDDRETELRVVLRDDGEKREQGREQRGEHRQGQGDERGQGHEPGRPSVCLEGPSPSAGEPPVTQEWSADAGTLSLRIDHSRGAVSAVIKSSRG